MGFAWLVPYANGYHNLAWTNHVVIVCWLTMIAWIQIERERLERLLSRSTGMVGYLR